MSEGKGSARRQAFAAPPDLESPGGELAAWYTSPPGAVVQMVQPMAGTVDMARWLVGPARDRMLERFPGVNGFVLVIDLSVMTTRDPAVRAIISEGAKEMRTRVARSVLIPPVGGGAIYLKSLEVSVLLLRGFGVNVEVSKSLPFTLTTLGLSHARAPGDTGDDAPASQVSPQAGPAKAITSRMRLPR